MSITVQAELPIAQTKLPTMTQYLDLLNATMMSSKSGAIKSSCHEKSKFSKCWNLVLPFCTSPTMLFEYISENTENCLSTLLSKNNSITDEGT